MNFHIPQINPMNWLILFAYFNVIIMLSIVKLHYLFREIPTIEGGVKAETGVRSKLNMLI